MKKIFVVLILVSTFLLSTGSAIAQQATKPNNQQSLQLPAVGLNIGTNQGPQDISSTLQLLLLLTILSLAPSILIMTTSYLRIITVFYFLRNALGTMQMPPNQLLAGIALFVTFFIMSPTWDKVNTVALSPLMKSQISTDSAYKAGIEPIRQFMFRNVRDQDIELFVSLQENAVRPKSRNDLSTTVLIPAFVVSELRAGFLIGFFVFIPFLVVDLIVSSILMAMGMMMLPPTTISLPFKILLFILVDGWNLIIGSLIRSFN